MNSVGGCKLVVHGVRRDALSNALGRSGYIREVFRHPAFEDVILGVLWDGGGASAAPGRPVRPGAPQVATSGDPDAVLAAADAIAKLARWLGPTLD